MVEAVRERETRLIRSQPVVITNLLQYSPNMWASKQPRGCLVSSTSPDDDCFMHEESMQGPSDRSVAVGSLKPCGRR